MHLSQWKILDFPEKGAPTPVGCANPLFSKIFAENCMKMKEIGRGGGRSLAAPWIRQYKFGLNFILHKALLGAHFMLSTRVGRNRRSCWYQLSEEEAATLIDAATTELLNQNLCGCCWCCCWWSWVWGQSGPGGSDHTQITLHQNYTLDIKHLFCFGSLLQNYWWVPFVDFPFVNVGKEHKWLFSDRLVIIE